MTGKLNVTVLVMFQIDRDFNNSVGLEIYYLEPSYKSLELNLSVHWGDIMSTSGDVQYIGGYHDECGRYHEYIGGCAVHRRDAMSTSGGYPEYIGGCSVHRRNILIHVGEQLDKILSTSITEHPPMYS